MLKRPFEGIRAPRRQRVATVLIWGGVLACALGLLLQRMWSALPWDRLFDSTLLAAVSLVAAWLIRRWRGWPWANALALLWLAALVFFVGIAPMLATALLAASALALGSLFVKQTPTFRVVMGLPAGLALLGGVLGWLLPLPIHYRLVYAPLLLGLCCWRRRVLRDDLSSAWRTLQVAIAETPRAAACAVLLLGLASSGAWLPTMQADDLAYHLGLPTQLQRHGFYSLDPSQQIWTLAPWLGDVVHGIAQVLAGAEARGAVDSLWVLSAAAGLGLLTRSLRGTSRDAWLVVALYASLPPLAGLAAGMQTELPATALLAALALAVLNVRDGRQGAVCGILAGGLVALKLSHAAGAIVLLIWTLLRVRGRIDWRRWPLAAGLFLVIGGSSYFYAGQVSGNPLLPMFNDLFRSPVMPFHQLVDTRWHAGFGLNLPWSITFDTARYLEARDGGFGFVLVALAGAWLLALWQPRTRGLACAASLVFVLPLLSVQYARYAFPGMVLLLPALLVAGNASIGSRRFAPIVAVVCALNVAYQANSDWLLGSVARKRLLTHGGDRDFVLRRFAPDRVLIAELRERDHGDPIVLAMAANVTNVAELAGRGRTVSWYSPALAAERAEADRDASGARWRALIDTSGARWLLLHRGYLNAAQQAALASAAAAKVDAIGDAELWSWDSARAPDRDAAR